MLNIVACWRTYNMPQKRHQLLRVLEAPLTYEEPVDLPPDQLFGVERGIPGLDEKVAENDVLHVVLHRRIGGFL